jgi:hypothetical protein
LNPLAQFEAGFIRRLAAATHVDVPDRGGKDITKGVVTVQAVIGMIAVTPAAGGEAAVVEGLEAAGEAAPGAVGSAGRGAEQTFEIVEGVRRAKAAAELGQTTIEAEVYVGGKHVETLQVPIDALRSPFKSVIDVSNPVNMGRWLRVLNGTKAGDSLPPIAVRPGANGITIPSVKFAF